MIAPRIALVHAMPVAIEPVAHVFREMWPQARVTHLLDDSLPTDLTAAAGIPATPGRKVLTSPHSAVARLKQMFAER